jgi:hypothetical protein
MKKFVFLFALCFALFINRPAPAQTPPNDPVSRLCYFTGNRINHIPRGIGIIEDDSLCRLIADRCVLGASLSDLEGAGIDSLRERIALLIKKNILKIDSGKYFLTIPVIMGEKRILLNQIVTDASLKLMPAVESMVPRLQAALGNRRDVAFHLLWSRIIDKIWWKAFEDQFSSKEGTPNIAWIVHPSHPYMVGTNYNSTARGEIAVTWSYGYAGNLSLIMNAIGPLLDASAGGNVADSVKPLLQEFGCADAGGRSMVFYYHEGDDIDELCESLEREYIAALHNVYDFKALSAQFNVPADDLFVIVMHETAYAVFEQLDRSGKLTFPPVLLGKGGKETTVQLVSVILYSH